MFATIQNTTKKPKEVSRLAVILLKNRELGLTLGALSVSRAHISQDENEPDIKI
jgi:hypothetical protein